MGNCVFRGTCELTNNNNNNRSSSSSSSLETNTGTIKVMTVNGGVMELFPPITAEFITNEFPNHAIFTTQHPLPLQDHPLHHSDQLHLNHSYFLLPIPLVNKPPIHTTTPLRVCATPYRMSLDSHKKQLQQHHKRLSEGAGLEMLSSATTTPRSRRNFDGVWKVKLVISPEQLTEILAQEATTEELVESLRTVAKCGNGIAGSIVSGSDKWSMISTGPNQFHDNIYGSSV